MELVKNNINKFIIAITLMLSLISICFVSTRTYAWTNDVNNGFKSSNLFDKENVDLQSGYIDNNGNIQSHQRFNYTNNYIDVKSNVYYTFSFICNDTTLGSATVRIHQYDTNNNYLGNQSGVYNFQTNNYAKLTINTNANCVKIKISYPISKQEMLNEGKYPLDYQPYNLGNGEQYITNYNEIQRMGYYDVFNLSTAGKCIYSNNGSYAIVEPNTSIPEASLDFINEESYLINNKSYLFKYTNDYGRAVIEYFDSNNNRTIINNNEIFTWHTGDNITGIYFENLTNNKARFELLIIDTTLNDLVPKTQYDQVVEENQELQAQLNQKELGIFGYLNKAYFWDIAQNENIPIYVPNTQRYNFTINDLVDLDILKKGGTINTVLLTIPPMPTTSNPILQQYEFNDIPIEIFALNMFGYENAIVNIYDNKGNIYSKIIDNIDFTINQEILRNNSIKGNTITKVVIKPNDANNMLSLNGNNMYTSSYNKGYNEAKQQYESQIEQLEQEKQQAYIEGKTEGYQQGANTQNTLYNMVIAVADTPINIFKQIFNFNILGLDISGFIFGLISLIIIVWLIKKII